MATNQEKFDEMHRETAKQTSPSRSWFARDNKLIDTPLGIAWNTDGNEFNSLVITGHLAGVPWCVEAVKLVAAGDFGTGSYISQQPWLQQMAQSYCKTLVPLAGVLGRL